MTSESHDSCSVWSQSVTAQIGMHTYSLREYGRAISTLTCVVSDVKSCDIMLVKKLGIRKFAYPYNVNHLSVETVDPPERKS
jgi:hypothetical protein